MLKILPKLSHTPKPKVNIVLNVLKNTVKHDLEIVVTKIKWEEKIVVKHNLTLNATYTSN